MNRLKLAAGIAAGWVITGAAVLSGYALVVWLLEEVDQAQQAVEQDVWQ